MLIETKICIFYPYFSYIARLNTGSYETSALILNSRDNWVSIITLDWAVELLSPVWSRNMVLKFFIIPSWALGSTSFLFTVLTWSLSPRTALTRDGVYLVLKLRCEKLISVPPYNCMVQCLLMDRDFRIFIHILVHRMELQSYWYTIYYYY